MRQTLLIFHRTPEAADRGRGFKVYGGTLTDLSGGSSTWLIWNDLNAHLLFETKYPQL